MIRVNNLFSYTKLHIASENVPLYSLQPSPVKNDWPVGIGAAATARDTSLPS